jgi:histidinol phosphatase-like enzyme
MLGSGQTEKGETGEEQSQNMLIIFFDIKGNVHKEFAMAGQTVNSAYYCDVLRRLYENVRRPRPELWRQMKWLLHHDKPPFHTFFFSPGNF